MNITTFDIDLAKNVFQLHGANNHGKKVFGKRVSSEKLMETAQQISPGLIGIGACGSTHYWARRFTKMGHTVKLMSPQYVKPHVKTNKNDPNDAEAICEAVTRPTMRFVSIKTIEQQDIQLLYKVRSKIIKDKDKTQYHCKGYSAIIRRGLRRMTIQITTITTKRHSNCKISYRTQYY